jgi:hypothetical protein
MVMKKSISILLLVATVSIFEGCMSAGVTTSTRLTNVGLDSNNYRIVETSISGEASGNGILGLSMRYGMTGIQCK